MMSDAVLEITNALKVDPEKKSVDEARRKIVELENTMLQMKDRQIAIRTTHYFSNGVYMREIFIPKGVTVTGKIHKTEHLNILSQGKLAVWTDDGIKTLTASTVIKSSPGTKRVGFAHEDSVWITVHHNPDNGSDINKIEEMLIAPTFEEALEFASKNHIETPASFITWQGEGPKQIEGEK